MSGDAPVNIGALLGYPFTASQRVLRMQTKLHRWAVADPGRRFDDLYNLVADPAFLVMAWDRVRHNTGARSAGVDKRTARAIEESAEGVVGFLEEISHIDSAEDQGDHRSDHSAGRGPTLPATRQNGPRLGTVLPACILVTHLPRHTELPVVASLAMVAEEAPSIPQTVDHSQVLQGVVAGVRRRGTLQTRVDDDPALPIPRCADPHALEQAGSRANVISWRAGCGESRTSGSGGRPRETGPRKLGYRARG
jgi:hypothetical protein